MHPDEPTYQLVLGKGFAGEGDMQRWLDKIYSLDARRYALHEKIEQSSLRLIATAGPAVSKLRRWINHTFALTNLSGAGAEEAAAVTKARQTKFDPDPRRSFLPHMVATAAEARLPLCFVRVKRHPSADGTVEQSESLRKYTSDLRKWIEDRLAFVGIDAHAGVAHFEMQRHIGPEAHLRPTEHHDLAEVRELDRVANEIDDDLPQTKRIAPETIRHIGVHGERDLQAFLRRGYA